MIRETVLSCLNSSKLKNFGYRTCAVRLPSIKVPSSSSNTPPLSRVFDKAAKIQTLLRGLLYSRLVPAQPECCPARCQVFRENSTRLHEQLKSCRISFVIWLWLKLQPSERETKKKSDCVSSCFTVMSRCQCEQMKSKQISKQVHSLPPGWTGLLLLERRKPPRRRPPPPPITPTSQEENTPSEQNTTGTLHKDEIHASLTGVYCFISVEIFDFNQVRI